MDSDHDYSDTDNTSDEVFNCPHPGCPKKYRTPAGKCNCGYCVIWYWHENKRKEEERIKKEMK